MRIYTGAGDKGRTSLFSGERISKAHLRIDAYGDVDELNSILGAVVSVLPAEGQALKPVLLQIQSDLIHVGAWLAVTPQSPAADDLDIDRRECGALAQPADHALQSVCRDIGNLVARDADRYAQRAVG